MEIEINATDEFASWYGALDEADVEAVNRVVDLLEIQGVALGYPHSSAIRGSKYALRELRTQSGGRPLRILYVFDHQRAALLLLGGDKTGNTRFYEVLVPRAERLFAAHLDETKEVEP